jgi:hypothetical protein
LRVVDFSRFSLWRDLRFVGGLLAGVAAGGLIGYDLGWEQTLGRGPGVLSLPLLLLMIFGQEVAWRALRRSRQMGEDKPQNADQAGLPIATEKKQRSSG